jgi:hypothetical protein
MNISESYIVLNEDGSMDAQATNQNLMNLLYRLWGFDEHMFNVGLCYCLTGYKTDLASEVGSRFLTQPPKQK